MAIPSAVFTEMVSTTLRRTDKSVKDNMSRNNQLYARLYTKGNVKEIADGGYEIQEPLAYAENSTFTYYTGYDVLDVSPSDVITSAKYEWKNAAVSITASGTEIRNNSGQERMINLVKTRTDIAVKTMVNNLNVGLYSDGTGAGGKQIGGLQLLVSDAGTGTIGGINSSTWTFWKNIVQSAAAPLGGGSAITPSKSTIKTLMNGLWYNLTRGGDKPDLIVADTNYYGFYEESLQDLQRFTADGGDMAKNGFNSLKYKSADVVFDTGSSIAANRMYFLNTDYMKFVVHKDANMKQGEARTSIDQDAIVIPIYFQGNLVVNNRSLQGILKA